MRALAQLLVYALSAQQSHRRRVSWQSKLIYAVFGLLVTSGCHRPNTDAPTPTLAVLTNLEGTTEPCGCTSRPLGGIDRIAGALFEARRKGPVAFAVVGETFFTEAAPTEAMVRHEGDKACAIADILAQLAPSSVVTGAADNGPMAHTLEQLPEAARKRLHLVLAPPKAGQTDDFPIETVSLGSITAALIAAPQPAMPGLAAQAQYVAHLSDRARGAREAGAQFVALLWPHGLEAARQSLDGLTHVDIVITGSASVLTSHAEADAAPELLGEATLVQGGARGERLGFLSLHKARAKDALSGTNGAQALRWPLFDGHKAERRSLEQRAQRLRQEAERLPEGPGRTARTDKAQALERQAQALPTEAPTTAYVTWHLEDIDHNHKPEPWASQALAAFNRSLCASARADTAARVCPKAEAPSDVYVGTETCRACHAQACEVYAHTAHARAWATLTNAGKECDLTCVGCHVVGFEQPGGFCHLADADAWANVGCESCHGPGAGHVAHPGDKKLWGKRFVRDTPEATCRGCHNQEHSDQFNFAGYRPQILGPGHGAPSL